MNDSPAAGLAPFYAMEMSGRAKMLEAEGRSICHLEVGEPSVPPAPAVLDAVSRALHAPQGYTHAMGRIELRRALAGYYRDRHGVEADPEAILVTLGSSSAFILSFLAAFTPGSRIAVTRPGYPAYLNTMAGLGFAAVEIPVRAESGWRLTAEDIAAAYRETPFEGLLFASPANPTGATVGRGEFAAIVETCRRLGVRLLSDEIYHGLEYGPSSPSALEFTDSAIVINSISKYYCMTGWRLGWMVVPPDLVRKAEMLQQSLFIAAPTLSQIAGEAALRERGYFEGVKAGYARNGKLLGRTGAARLRQRRLVRRGLLRLCRRQEILQRFHGILPRSAGAGRGLHYPRRRFRPARRPQFRAPLLCRLGGDNHRSAGADRPLPFVTAGP